MSVERDTFPALAAAGELYAMVDGAYWLDTGTPQAYLQANVDILNGRQGMHEFTDIVNCSWRHATSTVDASATLTNSVVDSDCVVGAARGPRRGGPVARARSCRPTASSVRRSSVPVRSSVATPNSARRASSVRMNTWRAASELSGEVRLGGV